MSDYLGGLTDEIEKDYGKDVYITEFVSTGPKCYSYKTSNGAVKTLIKGFSLNYKNKQHLNMDSMKELVESLLEEQKKTITVSGNKITRERHSRKVVNRMESKTYQLVYDKRIIIDGGKDTFPYGYMRTKPSLQKHDNQPQLSFENIKLYSEHYTTPEVNNLGEFFPYEDIAISSCNEDNLIDLMQTSDSEDEDDSLTLEDKTFLDDQEIDEDPSFYSIYA